jgi:hypothetical protein
MNPVDAIGKFTLEPRILGGQLSWVDLIVIVFHFRDCGIVVVFVIFVTVVSNVAIALLPCLPTAGGICRLISECRESNCASCLQGSEV